MVRAQTVTCTLLLSVLLLLFAAALYSASNVSAAPMDVSYASHVPPGPYGVDPQYGLQGGYDPYGQHASYVGVPTYASYSGNGQIPAQGQYLPDGEAAADGGSSLRHRLKRKLKALHVWLSKDRKWTHTAAEIEK